MLINEGYQIGLDNCSLKILTKEEDEILEQIKMENEIKRIKMENERKKLDIIKLNKYNQTERHNDWLINPENYIVTYTNNNIKYFIVK